MKNDWGRRVKIDSIESRVHAYHINSGKSRVLGELGLQVESEDPHGSFRVRDPRHHPTSVGKSFTVAQDRGIPVVGTDDPSRTTRT